MDLCCTKGVFAEPGWSYYGKKEYLVWRQIIHLVTKGWSVISTESLPRLVFTELAISPWANSKIVTSFSKSSGPRFDRLDGSRMIKKRFWRGSGELRSSNLVQNRVFLLSSSRPSERHAVDTVGVDLFVVYRRRLCDLPPMSGHGLDGHALCGARCKE